MSAEQDLANANVQIANLITEVTRFRDAAMGLNDIYPTITEGRQTVADGKYFSVPGSGAYMRLYRRQGTTAELIAEFADRSEINGILDQLGPLLGRGVVGGSGDLMAKTAFGIGSAGREIGSNSTVNLKALEKGIYFANRPVSDNVSGLPDYIGGAEYSAHIPLTGSSPSSPINSVLTVIPLQKRIIWGVSDGTETGLVPLKVLFDDDILGGVAFDAGTPSGGLFEKGSNDLGRYRKTADGQMQCSVRYTGTHSITTGVDNLYRSSLITVPLPQTFSSTLGMSLSVVLETGSGAALGAWIGRTRVVNTNTIEFCLLASVAITDLSVSVSIKADGDWA
ncbi:hypothetical protein [Vreelandella titanicae]|uniref:hypothetical protein n=1 Tax=Vreelandella titanicae TaxID=664683 RepID=UPI00241CD7C6|nr:hypothetical protein [Halomonas titanicae]